MVICGMRLYRPPVPFPDSRGSSCNAANLSGHPAQLQVGQVRAMVFQNGPNVSVELESTPGYGVSSPMGVYSRTGRPGPSLKLLLDEEGRVYFSTDLGLGLVRSQDVIQVADGIEKGCGILFLSDPLRCPISTASFEAQPKPDSRMTRGGTPSFSLDSPGRPCLLAASGDGVLQV